MKIKTRIYFKEIRKYSNSFPYYSTYLRLQLDKAEIKTYGGSVDIELIEGEKIKRGNYYLYVPICFCGGNDWRIETPITFTSELTNKKDKRFKLYVQVNFIEESKLSYKEMTINLISALRVKKELLEKLFRSCGEILGSEGNLLDFNIDSSNYFLTNKIVEEIKDVQTMLPF